MEKIINAIEEKIQEIRDAVAGQLMIILPDLHDHKEHLVLPEIDVLKARLEDIVKLEVKLQEIKEMSGDI